MKQSVLIRVIRVFIDTDFTDLLELREMSGLIYKEEAFKLVAELWRQFIAVERVIL